MESFYFNWTRSGSSNLVTYNRTHGWIVKENNTQHFVIVLEI